MTSNVKQEWYKELASLKEDDNDTTQLASQRDAAPVASAPLASFAFEDRHSPVKMEITDGKLEELPSRFGQQHEKLVVVDLSYQRITLIPESITDIPYLRNLDFRNNSLSSLPENIGNLKNLVRLDVRNNKITAIPPSAEELSKLTAFLISGNSENVNNPTTSLCWTLGPPE